MSGSQVFYMGDNGEVLSWPGAGSESIKPGVTFCATIADDLPSGPFGPTGATDSDAATAQASWYRGYEQALKDTLTEIVRAGKGHLVQWLEARLKDLP